MLIKTLHVCYNPSHFPIQVASGQAPFKIEDVDPAKPCSKIVRAILRSSQLDVNEYQDHELHKCYCSKPIGKTGKFYLENTRHPPDHLTRLKGDSKVQDLDLKNGDRVFLRRIDKGECSI